MKYNIGDFITCQVETRKNGKKSIFYRVLNKDETPNLSQEKFEVIGIQYYHDDPNYPTYKLVIPDDYIGWKVGKFHMEYQEINEKWLGKKFYEITNEFIINEEKFEEKEVKK